MGDNPQTYAGLREGASQVRGTSHSTLPYISTAPELLRSHQPTKILYLPNTLQDTQQLTCADQKFNMRIYYVSLCRNQYTFHVSWTLETEKYVVCQDILHLYRLYCSST